MLDHYPDLDDRWKRDADCRGLDPAVFFPSSREALYEAQAVCEPCPVRDQCLAYALDTHQREGVWGGLAVKDRRALRRTLAARAARA